ncbi:MAG: DUF488 domain-containing protein [Terriglobales bacterium]
MPVRLKRVYEGPSRADGPRILVERLWPRGLTKDQAAIDFWLKPLAPSTELRKWFHARPSMWREFRRRYLAELRGPAASAALQQLYDLVHSSRNVTLVFAARNTEHNSATVLKELLEGMRKPPGSSGPMKTAAAPARARAKR